MKFEVRRPFRWRQKELQRGDIITPRNSDEERRCTILAESRMLVPVVSDELLKNLASVGVSVKTLRAVTELSNTVKQREEEDNE